MKYPPSTYIFYLHLDLIEVVSSIQNAARKQPNLVDLLPLKPQVPFES